MFACEGSGEEAEEERDGDFEEHIYNKKRRYNNCAEDCNYKFNWSY